jgi:hypothetical protein
MASITESFAGLSELLLTEQRTRKISEREIFQQRLVTPLLPAAMRTGNGQIIDIKDRQAGPFDIIGCAESFPPLGEGRACLFMAEGVAFCLQVRNWKEEDLTQFAVQVAAPIKQLTRKSPVPIHCAVVGFGSLPAAQVADFLKSPSGQAIDGVLSIGEHVMLRNSQGWYGDPQRIPFVTERGEGEALKAFAFWLTHVAQTSLRMPYHLTEYQHL